MANEPASRPSPHAASSPEPRREHPRTRKAKLGVIQSFGWVGIFGVGAAVGAILGAFDVRGWIIGIAVSGVTVLLGFALRRSVRL
jgi:hypothetical protein